MGGISDFILSHPVWGWMAVGAVFLAVEVVTGSGWLLWPAGSAAITAVATLLVPLNTAEAVAIFGALTIITTYVGRRYMAGRRPDAHDPNNPLKRLVGHRGEAVAPFDGEDGRVFVDGKEWSAQLDGPGPVAAGDKLEVLEVLDGARLKVRAA
jgi:membrane protein implicated in regulation of membrane protease activity